MQYIYIFHGEDGQVLACFTRKHVALRWYRQNLPEAILSRYLDGSGAAPVVMSLEDEVTREEAKFTRRLR